jgi:predicted nucleic-acid-binding Zn-ribbon protein
MDGRLKMKKKLKMKIKMKVKGKIGDTASPPTLSHDVYDTEVHCEKCGTRLYVSKDAATLVLASLSSTGVAGLVCLCGHTEFIDAELRPLVMPMPQRRHD